ncbi:MAG: GcrA cell cycle regulator [Alphaproteobacteria bacterium]|nr:GcrA cell cycle regulator [Alphaproteobacteria bacterium]
MSKGWDNATLKKLKALMGKGLSTSEIGKRLGLSKNAVVGKLNRMGWNAKAGASTNAKTAKPAKKDVAPSVTIKKTTATKTTKTVAKKAPAKKPVATVKTKSEKKATTAPAQKKKAPTKVESKKPAAKVKTEAPKETATKSTKSSSKTLAMHQRIIQHSLELANLKPNQCRWPIGDPDSENFHFCGKQVFTGKPYCYEHCRLAYQFTPPKKK